MRTLEQKLKIYRLATFLLLLVILLGILSLPRFFKSFCPETKELLEQKTQPLASASISRTFELTTEDSSQNKFGLVLVKTEKVGMVTTQSQPVTVREGEAILLIYVEIENTSELPITVDSQNYFRLIDPENKKFAPDFYNGPIEVSPISTKKDHLGFIINESQSGFKLQVGEIEGEKEVIEFTL